MFLKNWTKGVVNSIKAMLTKKINISKFNFCPLILAALVLSLFLCLIVDRENRFDGYAAETPMFTYGGVEYYKNGTNGSVSLLHDYDISTSGTDGKPKAYLYSDGTLIFDGSGYTKNYDDVITNFRPWLNENITRIAISKQGFKPIWYMQNMFKDYKGEKIYQIENLDTSSVKYMGSIFSGCSNLTELDLSKFDTSSVISMNSMFYGCSKLTTLDVSGFNTSKVTNMNAMFSNCSSLNSIVVSNFDTSLVETMTSMFSGCSNLTTLDLSNFNANSVKYISSMFTNCNKLNKIVLPSNLNVTGPSLPTLNNIEWYRYNGGIKVDDTPITNLIAKSSSCDNIRGIKSPILFTNSNGIKYYPDKTSGSVTLSNTYNLNSAGTIKAYLYDDGMLIFDGEGITNQYKWTTSGRHPWYGQTIKNIAISNNGFKPIGYADYLFSNTVCEEIYQLDKLDTSEVTSMSHMFEQSSKLKTLNVSNFNTEKVTSMYSMFMNCSSLIALDLSSFNTQNVKSMQCMFSFCSSLNSLDVSSFDTSSVTDMKQMFGGCSSLETLDLKNFITPNVEFMNFMFDGCSSLETLKFKIDDTVLDAVNNMLNRCSNLKTLDLRGSTLSKNILPISTITSLTNIYLPTSVTGSAVNGISLPTKSGLVWMGYKSNKITDQKFTTLPVADGTVDEIRLMEEPYLYKNSSGLKYYKDRTSGSYTLSNTYNLNSAGTQKAYLYNDGMLILDGIYDSSSSTNYFNNANELPWYGKTVDKIAISNNGYAPTNTKLLFANYTGKAIYQLEKLDTSHVENMESMFSGCRSLTQLDLSHFDTSNVTNIWCMFMDCISLTKLDLSSFNTTNVYTMSNAFWGCTGLTELNISNFSISSTTTYHDSLFQSCNKLNKIILPSSVDVTDIELPTVTGCVWFKYNEGTKVDNTKVTNLIAKSASYDNIRSVNVLYKDSTGVEYYPTGSSAGATCVAYDLTDTSKSLAGSCMAYYYSDGMLIFDGAGATNTYTSYSLPWGNGGSGIQVNNIAISKNGFKPTSMSYLFSECKGTTIYQLEYLDTSNVTDMKYLFYKCRNLGSLNLLNFNTAKVTDMSHMFSQCNALTTLNVSSFDTSAVLYMNNMFDGCSVLNNLSVSNFNTAQVKDMSCMFDSCEKLSSLVLSNFNTAQVTDMHSMFSGCKALTTLNVSSFNTAKVTDMQTMFSWCNALTTLNLSSFDTSAVTMMNGMFVRCDALGSLTLGSNFKTNNVTSMYQMFANCYALNALNLSGFNTANVTNMYNIFMNNYALTELDLSKFEIKDLETLPPDLSTLSGLTKIKLPAYIKEGTTIDLPYSDDSIWLKYNDNSVANYTPVTKLITKSDDADSPYDYIKLVSKVLLYTDKNGTPDNTSDDILYYNVCTNKTTGDNKIDLVSVFDLIMPGKDDGNAKAYYYSDGMLIFDGYGTNERYEKAINRPWNGLAINAIAISNNGFKPKYLNHYFSGCSNITTIYQIEKLNTSDCIMMSNLFDGCTNLTDLNLSHFDTRNVTSMGYMFRNCTKLNNPHLVDSFVTSSLTSMYAMFQNYASEITTANVILELPSTFTGKNIKSSNQFMFSGFGSKTTGSVKIIFPDNFSIGSNVTGTNANKINLSDAFSSVGKNSEYVFIDFGDGFGGSQIMSIGSMFEDTNAKSISLKGIDLSNIDTSSNFNYKDVFTNANRLDKIELPNSIVSDTLIDLPAQDGYVWVKSKTYSPVDYTPITKLIAKSEGKYDCVTRISKDILYTDNMGTPDDISDDVIYYNVGTSDPSITLDKYDSDNDGILDTTCVWSLSNVGNVKAYLYTDGLLILDGEGPLTLVKDNPNPNHDSHYCAKIYPWREYKKLENITKVVASQSRGFIPVESIEGMFDFSVDYMGSETGYYTNLNPIPAFNIPSAIESIDFSNFDTQYVTSMKNLFRNNQNCKNYHLENLNVSNVTDFTGMLSGIRANNNSDYANLYLNNWTLNNDTDVNIDMSNLFSGSKLEDLNMSGWSNTNNIANISNMFASTYFHKNIDLSMMQFTNYNLADSDNVKDVFNNLMFTSDASTKIILPKEVDDDVIINLPSSSTDSWYGLDCNDTELGIDVRYTTLPERKGTASGLLNKIKFRKDILYSSNGIEYYKNGTNKTAEPNKITLVKAFDITDTSKSQTGSCIAYLYSDGMMIFDGEGYVKQYSATNLPWYLDSFYDEFGYQCEINHIAISNYKFTPKGYANYLFAGAKCDSIYQLNLMDTKDVTEMKGLFLVCSSLTSLDLSSFNTANVTNMYELFKCCSALTSLDLSSFNTAKVENMASMFNNCKQLSTLTLDANSIDTTNVNKFDTSQVKDMSYMFYNCKKLSTLDVSKFNTSQVKNMSCMFYECNSLLALDVSNFNTANVTSMNNMFRGCSKVTTLDVSNFNTSKVTDMSFMFSSCSALTTAINASGFDTTLVSDMQYMFYFCEKLNNISIKINDSALYSTNNMFSACDQLKTLDLTGSTLSTNILPISSISSLNKIVLPKTVTGSAVDSISLPTASWVMYDKNNNLINDTLHTKLTGYGDDTNKGKYLAVGIPISGATATFGTVTYNGSSQTPNFTLKYNSTTLVKDTDYEIVANSWTNNKNATTSSSKASVKVIGKGKYVGEKTIEFEIGKAPLEINFNTTYGKSSESDTLVTINQFIDSKKTKVFDNNDNIIINSTNKDNEFDISTGIGTESFKLSISGKFNDKLCDIANKVKYTFSLSEGNDQTKLSNYNVTYSPSLDETNCYEVDGSISKYTLSNDEIESIMDDFENATKTYDGTDVVKWSGNSTTTTNITILGFDISFIVQGKYQGNTDNTSVGTNKNYKLDLSFDNTASNYTNVTNNIKLPDGGVSKTYTSGSITASGVNSLTIQNNFPSEIEYDKKEHKPTINDIKVLKDGVEITNIADEFEIVLDNTKNYKDSGSYTFTVKAKESGNYSGTKDLSFDIKPCKIKISDLLLDTYTSSNPLVKEYDGSLSFEVGIFPTIRFKKQIDDSNELNIILDYNLTNSKYKNVSGRDKDNLGGKSSSERDKRDLIFSDVKLKDSDTNNYVLIDSDGTTVLNKFNSVSFDDCGQIIDTTKPVVLSSTKSVLTVGKGGTLRITLNCSEDIVHDFTILGFDASKLYIELFSKASNESYGKAVINTDSSLTKDNVLVFDYQVPTNDSFKDIRVEGFTIEIKNESSGVLLTDDCNNELVLDPLSDTVKNTFNDLVIDTRGVSLNINAFSDNTFTNEITRDSITNLFDIYYKFTFGSDVTGFDDSDIDVTNGTLSDFTKVDNKTYTCKVSNIGKLQGTDTNGIVQTVSVAKDKAQDANSNYNVADKLNLTIKRNLIIKDETLLLSIPGLDTSVKVIIKANDILTKVSYGLYEIFNNVIDDSVNFASNDTLTLTDLTDYSLGTLLDKYIIKVNGHKDDYISTEETYTYLIKNIDHIAKEVIDKVLPNLNPSDSDLRDIIKNNDNKDIYELPTDVRDILTNDNTNKVTDAIIVAIKDLIDDKHVDELDDSNIIKDEIAPIIVEIARLSDKIQDITTDAMDYEDRMIKYQSLSVYQKEYMNRHYHDEIENLHNKYYELIESCKSNTIESLDNEDSEVVEVYGVINKLKDDLTDANTEDVRSLSVEKINEEEKLNKINETLESESLLSDKKVIIPYDIKILLNGSPVENVKTGEKLLIKLKLPKEFFDAVFKIYHLDNNYNFKEEIALTKQLINDECLIYFFADSFSPYIPVSDLRTIRIESNDASLGTVSPLGLNAVNVGDNFTISITPNQGYYANVTVNGTKVKDKFNGGNYELTNIQENKDVFVEFVKNEEPQKPIDPEKPSITIATVITIQNANHTPYIDGYSDKTFRPNNSMTRAEFTKVISTISNNFNLSYDNNKYITKYKDVKEDSWYSNYVGYVTKLGLMKGYSDDTFKPNEYITRAEVSKVLSDMFNVPDKQIENIFFNELNGHWYFNSTNELIKGGVIKGYKDGTFKPNKNVTRAEVISLINRVKDREIDKDIDKGYLNMMDSKFKDVSKSNWFYNDLLEASIAHNSFDLH